MTGRDTLFTSSIRYSFRPTEWDRSLAATTVLRSQLGLVNPFFFARFTDGDPTISAPRGLTLAVNHGGEYIDLLRTVAAETAITGPTGEPIARLSNLADGTVTTTTTDDGAGADLRWSARRTGNVVNLRETWP